MAAINGYAYRRNSEHEFTQTDSSVERAFAVSQENTKSAIPTLKESIEKLYFHRFQFTPVLDSGDPNFDLPADWRRCKAGWQLSGTINHVIDPANPLQELDIHFPIDYEVHIDFHPESNQFVYVIKFTEPDDVRLPIRKSFNCCSLL